ncbi:uroporphyrinogen-III synthase [Alteromonas confluentis]|uniref:Uroporphyrinogen-III synthase n=1 Tax=Alteromonas confluentis TaxID=1656094 RepID=A0A1E7Z9Q5_9ALTE|nr:uroporphyrinogen-III synthase [Alteromonas confluentis]OFC70249.1 hypothetical protein BFC18_13795 [Alteromonas confluentis]
MILITRPAQKLTKSVACFRRAGIATTGCAPVTIGPCDQAVTACQHTLINTPPDYVIVTSAFAVAALPPASQIRSNILWFAVGNATAEALREAGFNAGVPEQQNSEGLLALSQLRDAKSRQIVIIKGQGGRTTLSNTLLAQGNHVEVFDVYHREKLDNPVLTDNWQWQQITGIVATSAEMAEQLFRFYDGKTLQAQRWLTVSERIAAHLKSLGVSNVGVCNDASDNALIAWIKDNWE